MEGNLSDCISAILPLLGEDGSREGLRDTPIRVSKAYKNEIFKGYGIDPTECFRVFDPETYDQMVLLKDVEMYSMCEHHMLPFFGKAHIAYIPAKRIIGISKLARLLEVYFRRLQIQERIGEQVTADLMEYLKPVGAACIIEASHLCMQMRGIGKQNSVMVTSSLKGVFLKESIQGSAAREELMRLIKN